MSLALCSRSRMRRTIHCTLRGSAAGVDVLADQLLAGLYMGTPAGIVLTLFGLSLLVAWLAEAGASRDGPQMLSPSSSGSISIEIALS